MAVTNLGNAAIANVVVTDPFTTNEAPVLVGGFNVGDINQDNLLDVDEEWQYTASHVVTQAEIDADTPIVNTATVTGTGATPDSDEASVSTELPPTILDGTLITNSNQTNQYVTMSFYEIGTGLALLHAAAKIYELSLQGQQGSIIQDVGFDINPSANYNVVLEASSGNKAIVTDFTLEGAVIVDQGNVQLEKNEVSQTNATATAGTAIINPEPSPATVQPATVSVDGNIAANTLTDTASGTLNYYYGASNTDTLTGSADDDVLNGGPGIDTLNGGGGNDLLIDNFGGDIVDGGDGFDILRVDDGALVLSQQGSGLQTDGNDTLGPADNVEINLSGKSYSNLEAILITEEAGESTDALDDPNDDVGTTLLINMTDVLTYSDADDELYILGSPGDKVQLADVDWNSGVAFAGSGGQMFTKYTATNSAILYIESEVQAAFV